MIPNKIMTMFVGAFLTLGSIYLAILSWNAVKQYDYIGVSPKTPHSIMIVGEGKVTAVPDVAKIQLGYSILKNTVAEAQKDNTTKMNGMVEKLKKDFKIDPLDIKTLNYSITPQYDWTSGRQVLKGYTVSQDLSVRVRALDKVSQILDATGQIGMNQVGSLSFEVDKPESLKQQAREEAIAQAKEKAEALSKVVGVKLGKIVSFSESASQPPAPLYDNYRMMEKSVSAGASPTIEAGSNEITVTATVEYEIL